MPQIPTGGTADLGLHPTEVGVDAFAGAARRVSALYNQTADSKNQLGAEVGGAIRDGGQVAVDYEDHREISAGAANGAQFVANFNDQWNKTIKTADPNDPSVKAKFLQEQLEPALEKFKSGFNTEKSQDWAEHFADQYRQHMFEKTSADMSTLGGVAVHVNAEKTINGLASAAYSDPSSLDFALKSVDHSIGGMVDSSPNIDVSTAASVKGELGQHAKEAIVMAAGRGMVTKNPDTDLSAFEKKYGEYLKPGEIQTLQKAAQSQAKVNAYYDKQTDLAAKQEADLNVHKAATKTLNDNVSVDPQTGNPILKPQYFRDALEIARQNPDAPSAAATARTMIDFGESQQNKEAKPVDDPIVKSDLMTRMFSADHPTTTIDLMKARADGKITDHTFQAYHGLVQELEQTPLKGPVWHDTIEAVKSELVLSNVGLPGKDITGEGNYAKWAQTFIPQYLAKSRAGTLEPNALDMKDPNSFISKSMGQFKRSIEQRTQDYLSTLSGAPEGTPGVTPTRKVGDVPVPAALGGIASLQYNKAKGQWRDQTSGKIYDAKGAEVVQ